MLVDVARSLGPLLPVGLPARGAGKNRQRSRYELQIGQCVSTYQAVAPRVTHTWARNEAAGQGETRQRGRGEERNDAASTAAAAAAGCRSLEGVKERPLSSLVLWPVVFVLEEGASARRRISRGAKERESNSGQVKEEKRREKERERET